MERPINETPVTIEQMRQYFIDPRNPNVEDFVDITSHIIRSLGVLYASHGESVLVPEINSPSEKEKLNQVINEILTREQTTRIFDHRFMGQIHPQGNKIAIAAMIIGTYMNTNTVVKEVSSAEHAMELEVIQQLGEMFGYDPDKFSGNIVTGGTTANLAALWVAREHHKKEQFIRGEDRTKKPIVLATSMAHYSIEKTCNILGMVYAKIPERGFKTDLKKLDEILRNMTPSQRNRIAAIVGLAGETETGIVDDLNGLANIAQKYGIYLHIDAAYGGPFILSKEAERFAGINRADSITVDPHKMLYTPYFAGAVLFRDKEMHALVQRGARYLQGSDNEGLLGKPEKRNFGFAARVEGSMGSAGVIATWATLRLFGKEGIKALLDYTIDLTQYAYEYVNNSKELRPLFKPETNSLLIGLKKHIRNQYPQTKNGRKEFKKCLDRISEKIQTDIGYYISVNEKIDNDGIDNNRADQNWSAFRFVAMHPYTTKKEVKELIDLIEKEIIVEHDH